MTSAFPDLHADPSRLITILNVDDDEAKRYSVTRILRSAGYDVEEAHSGEDAVQQAQRMPALIVLDVNLPGISGFEVCRRLKNDPRTAPIPVLHLSSTFVQSQDRAEGLESGADGYLTDVVEPRELLATVKSLLRIRMAEEAARRLALQWQTTFDAISDGVCLLDSAGIVRRCNVSLATLLSRSVDEIVDRPYVDALPDGIRAALETATPGPIEGVRSQNLEVADGHRWFRMVLDPVHGDAGTQGMVCVLSEITDRKRSEENLRVLAAASTTFSAVVNGESTLRIVARQIVPAFADACAFCLLDENGRIDRSIAAHRDPKREPAFQELLDRYGHSSEVVRRVLQSECSEYRSGFSPKDLERYARDAEELRLLQELGPSSVLLVPLQSRGAAMGVAGFVMTDAGRPYKASDVILAEELARRAGAALENARLYDELKQADRRKDEFLAMLAHELRNPLAPVRHAVALLSMKDLDSESFNQAIGIMERQVEQMVRLVDDLLDVSRILRGKIELQVATVDLRSVVDRAVETARPLIETHAHKLTLSLPGEDVWLEADGIRLSQVVANLLNNAAKYTPHGGQITLKCEADRDLVRLRVQDNGMGIAPRMLPLVFDLFTQADQSIARSEGGLGIGLTLVRTLVEMHGGTVSASSEGLDKGSEFTVQLPRSRTASEPVSRQWTPSPVRPLRVLVVEDNVGAATLLSRLLVKSWNHEVRMVHDGQAAIEEALRFHPELVLLDIGLPRMTGYEVAHDLRTRPEFDKTMLVALTGYGQQEDKRLSQVAGFDEHLVKPVHVQVLQRLFSHPKLRESF